MCGSLFFYKNSDKTVKIEVGSDYHQFVEVFRRQVFLC